MDSFAFNSVCFGVVLTILTYEIGVLIKKKMKFTIFNPLLVSIVLSIIVLKVFNISYASYNISASYLSYFLLPSTVCLAIPLYEQIELLKKNKSALITGIVTGVFTSLLSVFLLAKLLGFNHQDYISFLPKSITTAIGMAVSEGLEGYVPITVTVIVLTGVLGNVIAEFVFKVFRIKEPIAKGVALGTSAHAIGTSKAMEIGEVEGAMSSLSLVVCGVMTVFILPFFAGLI